MKDQIFTQRHIQQMISNPIYAGLGQYPAIISDAQWIQAALRAAEEDGHNFWIDVQSNVMDFLELPEDRMLEICKNARVLYNAATNDRERHQAFEWFLNEFRTAI